MTMNAYLEKLAAALTKHRISDADDIIEEYRQHFLFKLSDGFSEEEIAAKLGDPAALAAQFVASQSSAAPKVAVISGLVFIDLFAGMFFLLLFAWVIVMGVFAIACAVLAFLLIANLNLYNLIPPMPYAVKGLLGLSLIQLAVLTCAGILYFIMLIKQILRAYGHFRKRALGKPGIPPRPVRMHGKAARLHRQTAVISLCSFTVLILVSYIVACLLSSSFEFWHVWHWFA